MSCRKPFSILIWITILMFDISVSYSADAQEVHKESGANGVFIDQIAPDHRGGKAYRLVYLIEAPIESYWKFKTDFDNDFLVRNKYIQEHKFIMRQANTVITENKYANNPTVYFRWQTTVLPETHRLEFDLLNPEQCGQKYHYGHIQLASVEEGTLVTQVAYFDFLGATVWAIYPWRGGMRYFLSYTAHWEQETMLQLRERYEK